MINREIYMDKLWAYKDTEFIKVITGMRRCGKSSILKLFMQELKKQQKNVNVIYMNFESFEFDEVKDYKEMYNEIKGKISTKREKLYLTR